MPPLAAGAHDVEQPVQQASHVGGSWPAAGLGGRDEGRQQAVLVIAQRLARPESPDQQAVLARPHGGLQAGKPQNALTTVAATVKPTGAAFQNGQ
jgi:hypothetical protein